jgi:hypothetical protein
VACGKAGAERDRARRCQLRLEGTGHSFGSNPGSVALIAVGSEHERKESVPIISRLIGMADD